MKNVSAPAVSSAVMQDIAAIFASGDQWILPPIPLLDEEFDEGEGFIEDHEFPLLLGDAKLSTTAEGIRS